MRRRYHSFRGGIKATGLCDDHSIFFQKPLDKRQRRVYTPTLVRTGAMICSIERTPNAATPRCITAWRVLSAPTGTAKGTLRNIAGVGFGVSDLYTGRPEANSPEPKGGIAS